MEKLSATLIPSLTDSNGCDSSINSYRFIFSLSLTEAESLSNIKFGKATRMSVRKILKSICHVLSENIILKLGIFLK
jgi:hypothetical protein